MSAGGTGGVGGRREKTTALADECDSRCGARAATLTDEELEGEPEALEASPPILEGRSAATAGPACAPGSPYASHERARLDEAVVVPPEGSGFGSSLRHTANRARCSISLHYRIASLQGWVAVDQCGTCRHHRSDRAEAFRLAVMLDGWRPAHVFQRRETSNGRCYEGWR